MLGALGRSRNGTPRMTRKARTKMDDRGFTAGV
jgi:hypothetical protein